MHIYAISLPPAPLPPDVFERLAAYLTPEAVERVNRFRLPDDVLRSLAGRLAPIWYLRSQGLLLDGQSPVFAHSETGKPRLAKPELNPPLAFNTSHDGRYVLLGVTRGSEAEVGVDLMQLPEDPLDVQMGISEQLTFGERQNLASSTSTKDRAGRLATLWTFKEGYTKAIGEGIGFGLERVELHMDRGGEVEGVFVDGKDVKDLGWYYAYGQIEESYAWMTMWKEGDGKGTIPELELVSWETFAAALS